ncbi:sortase [Streptomyces sp. NPDC005279]|uniref:sortase n=1 Tax=Streptomyces sp. NPDC005279 TaxID=3364712 RepID=UPI00369ABC00
MRNTRVGVSIGLVIAALGLSASAAVAAGDPDLDIGPGDASPGSTVTVRTTACGRDVTYGKGESEAGGAFHLFKGERAGVLTGEFQVPEDTEPGSDTVTVKCPPRTKVTDTYQVAGHQPSGAVDAGFGPAGDRGTQFALLGVLLAGAAAGGVVRRRRRLSGNRT